MPLRIVQKGTGDVRPLIVVYHADPSNDERIKTAVGERPCVINYNAKPFEKRYAEVGVKGLQSLKELWTWAKGQSGATAFSPVIASGWSEGCQGVRALLRHGETQNGVIVDGVVAVDGVHSDKPIPSRDQNYKPGDGSAWDRQIAPWGLWMSRGDWGGSKDYGAIFTHTEIDPMTYSSVRATLEFIFKAKFAKSDDPHHPEVWQKGNIEVWSFTGTTANDHIRQLRAALPHGLNRCLVILGELKEDGPERAALEALLKGESPQPVEPKKEEPGEAKKGSVVPWVIGGVGALGLAGAAGWYYWQKRKKRGKAGQFVYEG